MSVTESQISASSTDRFESIETAFSSASSYRSFFLLKEVAGLEGGDRDRVWGETAPLSRSLRGGFELRWCGEGRALLCSVVVWSI